MKRRHDDRSRRAAPPATRHTAIVRLWRAIGPRGPWSGALLAGLTLLVGGAVYRSASAALEAETSRVIRLDPPLATLPLTIGSWAGEDVPVSEGVQRIARNDDFVSRVYRDQATGESVTLFIGYTARPRTMLRHRPTICYPSAGWTHVGTQVCTVRGSTGFRAAPSVPVQSAADAASAHAIAESDALPVLVHHFLRTGLVEQRRVVLSYYVLCGQPTVDESSFWSMQWRTPNLARDAHRYVAQVQIAAPAPLSPEAAESAVRRFAAASAAEILRLLPVARTNEAARS